jgi:hypothetical protein
VESVSHSSPLGAGDLPPSRGLHSSSGPATLPAAWPLLRLDQPPFRLGEDQGSFSPFHASCWGRGGGGFQSVSLSDFALLSSLRFSPLETES